MSELEKKFKEYVKTNYLMISPLWITKLLIKDLAEIAEKENTELKKQLGEGVVIAEGIAGDEKWCKEIRLNAPKLKGKKGKLIFIEEE